MPETIYLKFDQNSAVYDRVIKLKNVAAVFCEDTKMQDYISDFILINVPEVKKKTYVFSVMDIVVKIKEKYQDASIVNLGVSDFIVEYNCKKPSKNVLDIFKIIITCVVVFTGSMFTIMAYNNDININELFKKLYLLSGNGESTGVIELCYSLGLFLGICIFYNHFVGKSLDNTPTPVEMQMRSYEDDLNCAIIERASRLGKEQEQSDI